MNRIVFVTRANRNSGRGHFYRVLRIIEELKVDCECILVCDENVRNEIADVRFHPFNQNNPSKVILELCLTSNDLVWFDIPDSEYEMIKSFNGYGISIISTNMFEKADTPERHEDIAIYPVFEKYKKHLCNDETVQLSGSDFISIPVEFFYKNEVKKPTVIVSMGGTDPMNFTPLVLESISKLDLTTFTFKIILPKSTDIKTIKNKYDFIKHMKVFEFGSLDFPHELKHAEYAIINGGMTRYECIASETHFIALSIHEKQESLTEKVTRYNYGTNFGFFDKTKIDILIQKLSFLPYVTMQDKKSTSVPLLRSNSAKWIYKQIIRELNCENK